VTDGPTRWTVELPTHLAAVSLNGRGHYQQRAAAAAAWREAAGWAAKVAGIPTLAYARVQLVHLAADRRRRDADNLAPTSKAVVDGLRDAGVLADDDVTRLDHAMPSILLPVDGRPRGPRWAVTIEALTSIPTPPLPDGWARDEQDR
jgi:crossover junction endodeoxyribonuclease RusA